MLFLTPKFEISKFTQVDDNRMNSVLGFSAWGL